MVNLIMWCSACHGFGYDPFYESAECIDCDGLGGFNIETHEPTVWLASS